MMQPAIALVLALLTWLMVRNRPVATRLLLGGTALLLGWEPASAGSPAGGFLLVVAGGVGLSLAWDAWARTRARPSPAPEAESRLVAVPVERPTSGPAAAPVPDEPMTELDRADAYGDLLDAYFTGLAEAQESGDVRAQAAFAGEIADIAQEVRLLLRVVVTDRQRHLS
jgi:hypothetical protein